MGENLDLDNAYKNIFLKTSILGEYLDLDNAYKKYYFKNFSIFNVKY